MSHPREPGTRVVAVYGGSFSPPHVGHAMVASWLRWTERADEVWLLPVFRHAFEGQHGKQLASFEDRCAWCEALAEAVGPGVKVCRIEAELPTPSYTIDTLRSLRDRHPGIQFRLVLGSDVLSQLPEWRDWDSIEREFSPIIVARAGYPADLELNSPEFPGVSSSDIRQRLVDDREIGHLVPATVLRLLTPGQTP
jgi:nicotinate-nucleotide adenylyltransferase